MGFGLLVTSFKRKKFVHKLTENSFSKFGHLFTNFKWRINLFHNEIGRLVQRLEVDINYETAKIILTILKY